MTGPLDACFEKIKRAREHLTALDEEFAQDVDLKPYRARLEVDRQHVEKYLLSRDELGEANVTAEGAHEVSEGRFEVDLELVDEFSLYLSEDPFFATRRLKWSVLVGEAAYQLRSTLEHLVYALTLDNGNQPPPDPVPRDSPWRKIAFPVVMKSDDWDTNAVEKLWGLTNAQRAEIDGLQPYRTDGQNPELSDLYLLNELWNRDKHRAVNVVVSNLMYEGLSDAPIPQWSDEEGPLPTAQFRIIERKTVRALEAEAQIARLEVLNHVVPVTPPSLHMQMEVNLEVSYNVAFDEGPPTLGRSVPIFLGKMILLIEGLLTRMA